MGILSSWLAERRIASLESKIKRAHAMQRQVRDRLHDLDARRKKGGMTSAEYDAEKAKLEAKKHDLTERIHALQLEEDAAKRRLEAAGA